MASTFPPQKDADLLTMATGFSEKVSATPVVFGYSTDQAAATAAATAAYSDALAVATNPATRTKTAIVDKDTAKRALAENLRLMNRIAQANPALTDGQKTLLGLPVYASRTPINPPTTPPVIKSINTVGRNSKVVIRGLEGDRRGRPTGVQGAVIMSFVGATPPLDLRQWTNEGLTTRTETTIVWPPSVPAHSVCWITAAWYSPRGQFGPNCDPVSVAIGGGVSLSAPEMMKEAA